MRWDSLETDPFARPVHWIGAVLDGKPLQITFADVTSGAETRGHRFHAPGKFALPAARKYLEQLREAAIAALARWQRRAESPLSDRAASDRARVVVRSCEGMLARLSAGQPQWMQG